jgi:ElaB/YqjD/DUF883 family membrane-anchored ribosome-binding protein
MVDREPNKRDSTSRVESSVGNWGTSGSGSAGQQRGGTGGEVKQQAGEVAGQVKEQAMQLKDQVAETATSKLEDQKSQATSSLGNVSDAFRQTGDQLRSNDQEAIAQYVDRAAEQIDHFSGYLRSRDMRQIVGDVEAFARREPALFLGGAFVLGLLGARFLKSSSQAIETQGTDWQSRQSYGTQAALSSYTSYASMPHTQRIPVRYDAPATSAPTGAGTSYPTPTAGGGMSGLGTGGSVTPARPSGSTPPPIGGTSLGSTSSGAGAPGWQGGASHTPSTTRPDNSLLGTEGRDTTGSGGDASE